MDGVPDARARTTASFALLMSSRVSDRTTVGPATERDTMRCSSAPRACSPPPRLAAGSVLFMLKPGEEGYHGAPRDDRGRACSTERPRRAAPSRCT